MSKTLKVVKIAILAVISITVVVVGPLLVYRAYLQRGNAQAMAIHAPNAKPTSSPIAVPKGLSASTYIPTHIRNYTYYGQSGVWAIDVPASYMGSHEWMTQGNAQDAVAAKNHGSAHALIYARPLNPVGGCPASGGGGSNCTDQFSAVFYVSSPCEGCFLHTSAGGPRVFVDYGGNPHVWADWIKPDNSLNIAGWATLESNNQSQGFDWQFCDNFNNHVNTDGFGGWGWSGPPIEFPTDAAWQTAVNTFLTGAVLPCVANSGQIDQNSRWTAAGTAMAAVMWEAGFTDDQNGTKGGGDAVGLSTSGGCHALNQDPLPHDVCWDGMENFTANEIYATTHGGNGASAIMRCGSSKGGATAVQDRNYCIASYWLTYDPNQTIYYTGIQLATDKGSKLILGPVPEEQIIPASPLHTLSSTGDNANILGDSSMCNASPVCWREFATGYHVTDNAQGVPGAPVSIGHVIAIVNPDTASHSIPTGTFTNTYTHCLVISADNKSLWDGGTIRFSLVMPSIIKAFTGLICEQ